MSDRRELFSRLSSLEKEYAEKLSSSASSVRNPAIKAVMKAVSTDSLKHSALYATLLEFMEPRRAMLTDEEADRIREEIERHIETEGKMIEEVKEILKNEDLSKAEKFILEMILRDEVLHHALLKRVHEILVSRETLTESDLWDMVWKDTTYHGGPGG